MSTNNLQACRLQWNVGICTFGHRYLNLNNLNLKQENFRLLRKNTKMYRILNRCPSHGVMSISHISLRCRVSRTGHTFLTSPVTPECRFPKGVHRANCFLAGQNNPHWAQFCSSYIASSCTRAPAFKDNLAATGYHIPCDCQHGLGFLSQLASGDLTTRLTRMLLSFQMVVSTKKAAHLPPHVPWNEVSIPLTLANNTWGRLSI